MRRFGRTISIAVATVIAVCAVICAALVWLSFADRALPVATTAVTVDKGASFAEVTDLLRRRGVIRSARLFRLFVRAERPDLSVEAAEYNFPAHETMGEVVAALAAGGRPVVVWLTVPEGFTARQIAHRLEDAGVFPAADFLHVAFGTSIQIDGVRTKNLEGYLFPDTYSIPRDASPASVAAMMTRQFVRELPRDYRKAAQRLRFSVPQIVTIASLIEREAKVDRERPLMAGVYYNRLRRGMPLQVDATIEYALPQHKSALSYGDLAIDSPYNTYVHAGLPPTPIANPGKASPDAAFHPRKTDFLYYVYMGDGRHKFSKTLEEQQRAERLYLH